MFDNLQIYLKTSSHLLVSCAFLCSNDYRSSVSMWLSTSATFLDMPNLFCKDNDAILGPAYAYEVLIDSVLVLQFFIGIA